MINKGKISQIMESLKMVEEKGGEDEGAKYDKNIFEQI